MKRNEIEADIYYQIIRILEENELDDRSGIMNMIANLFFTLHNDDKIELIDILFELAKKEVK